MKLAKQQQMIIGNSRLHSEAGETLETIDPATGKVLAEFPRGRKADVDAAVKAAQSAQCDWVRRTPVERSRTLLEIARAVEANSEELAWIESIDTGKPLTQARADVRTAARYFEFYGGLADKLGGITVPLGDDYVDYTTREPVGVSGQIVPWNYPLQIGARGIAPALAAGNSVVVKPAEGAPLSLLRLAEIAQDAGLAPGLLNVVTGLGSEAGAALAGHPGIDQVTFTGSVQAGTLVMQAAATNINPVTLELGGKCPNLVFEDADLDAAVPVLVSALIQNAGQTCSAATRLIVARELYEPLIERLRHRLEQLKLGPGVDDPDMGPMISASQLKKVAEQVQAARAGGATVFGGEIAPESEQHGGNFYLPTIISNVDPSAPVAKEELFGPVLVVLPFEDDEEAVRLANGTDYGLVCGVWTNDVKRAHRVARDLHAGQVYINAYGAAGGVEIPFGGLKKSGFGREKGIEGLNSYLQTKNVCVRL